MLELSILELAAVVLGSAGAGGYLSVQIYKRWLDEETVDLDAIAADKLLKKDHRD